MIGNCPGVIKSNTVSPELIDFSDIFPTLVELSGAQLPSGYIIDGYSFASILLGKPNNSRKWIFSYLGPARILRDHRWLLTGEGYFFDCGNSRDGTGYNNVTDSTDSQVVSARKRFDQILSILPPPDKNNVLYGQYHQKHKEFMEKHPGHLKYPDFF